MLEGGGPGVMLKREGLEICERMEALETVIE